MQNDGRDQGAITAGGWLIAITQVIPSWYDQVYSSYKDDAKLQDIIQGRMLDTTQASHFTYTNGVLKYKGRMVVGAADEEGRVKVYPIIILDRKLMKKGNTSVVAGLIQWSNSFPEDATWEELTELQLQFPDFNIAT
uniref:Uncharacterized protein n=1 Tax=Populus alba TaxID=43335 RepID=A0A4U5QAD5_POPAL|nr:hypothetical protein D5086_0000119040 [Populus alba]